MRNERLTNAFGRTPDAFSARMDQTLRQLKEEIPMKRFTLRTALIAGLMLLLLCSIAYAVVTQGMEWYYTTRFTAYQQYEPEKYEAIMHHAQTVQTQESQTDALVRAEVREASWAPEHNTLVVLLAASPADPQRAELHPAWNLDADGSYVGAEGLAAYADDPEARAEHWLVTAKGFGPVKEMMHSPDKQLLLFEASEIYLTGTEDPMSIMGDNSSMDCYVNDTGEVMTVIEARLEGPMPTGAKAQLSIPYTVTTYSDNDEEMRASSYTKQITFEITLP